MTASETRALYAWGANSHGQLALGHTEDELLPVRVSGLEENVKCIVGGGGHTFIINGNDQLLSCGWNNRGQLGRQSDQGQDHSVTLKAVSGALSGARVSKVAAGWDHSAAITDTGQLYTWGSNAFGQLGHKGIKSSETPILVEGFSSLADVACGMRHTLVLTCDNEVYACGAAKKGQLGIDIQGKSGTDTFKKVCFSKKCKIIQLCAGEKHSAALTDSGDVFVWGHNRYGQLVCSPDEMESVMIPHEISRDKFYGRTVVDIQSGWSHIISRCSDGSVLGWGRRDYGQLGIDKPASYDPILLDSVECCQIACGSEHNIALTEECSVITWGWNEHGMCATGNEVNILTPHQVQLSNSAVLVGCGNGHSMAFFR